MGMNMCLLDIWKVRTALCPSSRLYKSLQAFYGVTTGCALGRGRTRKLCRCSMRSSAHGRH